MSDSEGPNRRDAMRLISGALAYTTIGAMTIGPLLKKAIDDSSLAVSVQMAKERPDLYNPKGLSITTVESNLREAYKKSSTATAVRCITTALGASTGFVSHDKVTRDDNLFGDERDAPSRRPD